MEQTVNYLNEDQELMLDSVRELCEKVLEPRILTDIENDIFPADVFAQMQEMGLPSLTLPEEYGGLAESMVLKTTIEKEIAKHSMSLAFIGTDSSVAHLLLRAGRPEQIATYMPMLMEKPGAFGFTEPTGGSDVAALQTVAKKDGNDWIINGQKTFISFVNQCDLFLIAARTNETGKGGISTFLVHRDTPGFKVGSVFHKLGMKASDTGELFLDDVRVPGSAMIGPENKGMYAVLSLLDEARIGVAAVACGIAEAAIEKAATFAKERIAFGGTIAAKQGIQWYFAEMKTKLAAAEALLYEVAQDFDAGRPITVGAAEAKYFAAEMALQVTEKAVQICGGYGLMDDFGVERLLRDAKCCSIIEGTSEILKLVVAREVLA